MFIYCDLGGSLTDSKQPVRPRIGWTIAFIKGYISEQLYVLWLFTMVVLKQFQIYTVRLPPIESPYRPAGFLCSAQSSVL